MHTVDIEEARLDLARLVEQAVKGQPFLIAREGQPLVKVSRVESEDLSHDALSQGLLSGQALALQDGSEPDAPPAP